jgi:diguanylate cyclase (GGDEF)-like protein
MNRAQMRVKLNEALADLKRAGGSGAYLLAGIDDVGAINADFGFDVADEVIVECSRRIADTLAPDDLIGRVAGTKFGVFIAKGDSDRVREVCVRLLNTIRERVIETQKGSVAASISIGAVEAPRDADSAHAAMARAEAALDQAKRLGRSSWSSFSEKTDVVTTRRRNSHMSDVILTALNERRVRLAFQPIVSDIGESPSKFECLIRMRAIDGREVPAPEFIPAAERLGLVHLLDRRVLELAVNTLAACPNIKLNVNVSMETVKDPVWAEGYLAVMRANENLARRITVELTETQVIDAIDASIEFVSELKKIGASFGIDDFGAGYTSFRNLKALDIDILKIDGSFVTGVSSSRENQLFVRTLLDLARNFGMKTVAEWVENEADAMLLKGLGVDFLQGYMIGKPETNPAWLPNGAPDAAHSPQTRISA